MGRHSTLSRNRQKPLWRVVTSVLGIASMVGAAAVAGTVISAQADTADGLSVTAVVAPTPESGAPTDATALAALASLSAGSTVVPGAQLTYVLTATNAALTGDPEALTVVDDLSDLVDDAEVSGLPEGASIDASGMLTWTTPEVGANQHVTMSFQATVKADVADGATLNTSATVNGGECSAGEPCATSLTVQAADADGTTDADAAPTTDAGSTDESGVPADESWRYWMDDADAADGLTAAPDQTITFSLHADTTSATPLSGAVVVATLTSDNGLTLPDDVTITPGTPSNGTVTVDGAVVTWALGELTAGAEPATATFGVTLGESAPSGAHLTVAVDSGEASVAKPAARVQARGLAAADTQDEPTAGTPGTGSGMTQSLTYTIQSTGNIVVHLGGYRTGTSTVDPLPAGATLRAVPVGGGTTLTCTSGATGLCTFANASVGTQYDISQTGAPSGWYTNTQLDYGNSTAGQAAGFVFRTKAVVAGTNDVPGSDADSSYCDTKSTSCPGKSSSSSNGNPFLGLWQTSVKNNPMPSVCGLNIALVMDVSGSMGLGADGKTAGTGNPSKLSLLQTAANGVVDALIPATSTKIALYSFAQSASRLTTLTTNTSNTSNSGLHYLINHLNASGGTNWDQGLYQVVSNHGSDKYDLVVVLTDGNPTYDHNGTGNSNYTRFDNVSQGIFSANAIKNLTNTQGGKTRITTIGIGVLGGDENIRAISGDNSGSTPDYYLSSGSNFGDALKSTLLANCSLTVTKQVQSASGTAPASGWTMNASVSGQNWSPTATDSNGNAVFQFNPLPTNNVDFTVTENSKTGYHVVPVDGKNMQCMQGTTPISVTNTTSGKDGVTFTANPSNGGIHCTITNSNLVPPTLTLEKIVVGGSDAPSSWTLSADGTSGGFSGAANGADVTDKVVTAGVTYTLSESDGPSGYDASKWACTGASTWDANAGTVTPHYGENVTCSITNTRQSIDLTLQKTWVNGKAGDSTQLRVTDKDGNLVTATDTVGGTHDTATAAVNPGSTVNLSEVLGTGNKGSYTPQLTCTAGTVTGGSALAGTVLIPSGQKTPITCTYQNTRTSSTITLQKAWVNGYAGDSTALSVGGSAAATQTGGSTAAGTAGTQTDSSHAVSYTALSGDSIALSETLGASNHGAYRVSDFGCTGGTINWSQGASATVTAPGSGTVTCTVTNERTSTTLTLKKHWANADTHDVANLSITPTTGQLSGSDTATATVPAGGSGDAGESASVTVYSGDTLTLGETLPDGNVGGYQSTISCTPANGFTAAAGGRTGTLSVPKTLNGDINCLVTNTRGAVSVTLQKAWVTAADGDTTTLSINNAATGAGTNTSTADGSSGTQTDTVNVATADVPTGSTVALKEALGAGNTGSYNVSDFQCVDGNNKVVPVTWTDGEPTASFKAPGSGTVTCTVTNSRTHTLLTLQKTWVGGMSANDAALTITGSGHSGTDSAVATVPSDNFSGTSTQTAHVTVYSGDAVDLSEVVGGPNAAYAASLSCDAGDLTYTAAAKSGSLKVTATPSAGITCTFTNTAQPGKWKVEKTSTPATGSVVQPDQTITYTLKATHVSGVSQTNVTVTDDLSDVVNHATFGAISPAGAATYNAATETLTWNIAKLDTTATISYTVTVDHDAKNVVLRNHATGGNDGPCVTVCTTQHIVPQFDKMYMNTQQHLATDGSWDGSWDVTYLLSVQNPSADKAVTYDLSDTPAFPADVHVNGAIVESAVNSTATAPDTPISDTIGTWSDPTLPIVSGRSLPAHSTDKYTVVVNAAVPPVPAAPTCDGTPEHGLYNAATATFGAYSITDDACGDIPQIGTPTITKTVAAGSPAQNSDGTWTITYSVVVDNTANDYAARYSLSDAPDFGGDITISNPRATGPGGAAIAGWTGAVGHTTLATDATVAKKATATYTVTVTADVAAGAYTDNTATCGADKTQSAGHGFFNKATLTVPGATDQHAADCASPVTPTLTKTGGAAIQHTDGSGVWDGTWDVTYTVTVGNTNDTAVYYTLSDTPRYPNKAAIVGVTSTLGGTPYGTWNGSSIANMQQPKDATPAAAKKLGAHDSDVYTVVVNVTVAPDIDPGVLQCATTAPKAGHGYFNESTVVSGGYTDTKDACGPILLNPKPTVTKTVTGVPVQRTNGSWDITYDLAVTNPSVDQIGRFDLSDSLAGYGSGITVTTAPASDAPHVTGPGASSTWNGDTDTTIVTNRSIAAGATLHYTVTVNATVALGTPEANRVCTDTPTTGHGFFNTATITVDGVTQDDSACASPVTPDITKKFESVEQHAGTPWNGTWDVTYTVTVTNPSKDTGLVYSLSDTPDFPAGVTINSASATRTGDGSVGSWTSAPFDLASARALAATDADEYTVTVNVTVDSSTVPAGAMDCTVKPYQPKNGLFNAATVTSGGYSATAIDCGDIPQAATPTLTKSVIGVPVQDPATGYWAVTYKLLVDNSANDIAARYSLTDSLAGYASGIDVKSASVSPDPNPAGSAWNGEAQQTIATNASIAARDTVTYTVTVTADVTAGTADGDWACTTPPSSGHGFFNTATITAGGQDATKTACAEPVKPTITKTFVSADQSATSPWDGTWDATYTVTVTNPSTTTGLTYSLTDSPDFPAGVTINSGGTSVTGDHHTANADWNGTDKAAVVGPVALSANAAGDATDTYTFTVNVTVDSNTVPAGSIQCGSQPYTPQQGLYNAATVTSGGYTATAVDCGDVPQPPKPTIAKTVKTVTQGANGAWTVVYDLDVQNTSKSWSAPYDLSDTLKYGGHITVTGQTVAGPVGLTTNPSWNGGVGTPPDSTIVSGGVIAKDTTLHFTVTVTATVQTMAKSTDLDCDVTGTETGTGFLNSATLVSGSNTVGPVTACATPVLPEIVKTVGTATQHMAGGAWDGTWDVTYTLTVHNPSVATATAPASNLTYTLSDSPAYPAGVTAHDGTVTGSDDGNGATVPGIAGATGKGMFSGGTLSIITATSGPRDLAAGKTDTFQILVNATVPLDQDAGTLNCVGTTPGHGFDNVGTVTSGNTSLTDSACVDIPLVASPTIHKTVTSTTQGADGLWTITYKLDVDNSANDLASMYTLDDTLDYGAGIGVRSAKVDPDPSGTWDGDAHTTIATDKAIAAKTTATYVVTVTAEVTDKATTTSIDCVNQTTPGRGFFNGATLTVGTTKTDSSACSSPAVPTIDKTFGSAVANPAGGWDVTYTVTVTNPSTDTALYYSLSDTPQFAAGVTVSGAAVTASDVNGVIPGSYADATGTLTIIPAANPVSLGAGDSDSFTIVVSTKKPTTPLDPKNLVCNPANPVPGQGFYNRADASSGGVTYSDEACGAVPAWTVAKTVDKVTAHPGDTLTYTLTAANIGSVDVTGAVATDTLPANVTIVDTATDPLSAALTLSADGKTLTWTLPTLTAPGGSSTASYKVTVDADAAGTTQTNLIVPSTPGGECVDNDPANCTTETDIPAWTLQKTSDPATGSTVARGSTITYTLTATNKGPGVLSGATVRDDLSKVLNNAAFVAGSITPSGTGGAALTGTDLDWDVPDLAVGADATVSYRVTVNSDAYSATLVNVATPGDPGGVCLDNDPKNCTTTHRTPGPPSVLPSSATPAYTLDQCVLASDNGKLLTVSTAARTGLSYTITGNGTAAVTITATADAGYELNVPAGWSGDSSRATITVRATDSTLCVGSESSTVPPSTRTANVVPSATDNVQVLPTHRDEVGSIAYTGVNTIGMSALALLLLGAGVLLLWFGLAVRREQREH